MIFQKLKEYTDCSLRCIWTTKQNASQISCFHSLILTFLPILLALCPSPASPYSPNSSGKWGFQQEALTPCEAALPGQKFRWICLHLPCIILAQICEAISLRAFLLYSEQCSKVTGGSPREEYVPLSLAAAWGPWCRYEDTRQRPLTQSPASATLQPPPGVTSLWKPDPAPQRLPISISTAEALCSSSRCSPYPLYSLHVPWRSHWTSGALTLCNPGLSLLITCCPTALQRWPLSSPAPADRLLLGQSCELLYCPG